MIAVRTFKLGWLIYELGIVCDGDQLTILGEQKHAIDQIQFDLIRWKMADSDHCSLSIDEINLAIEEYKRFLSLKVENPSAKLSPTKLMDEVWHFHILDTKIQARLHELIW